MPNVGCYWCKWGLCTRHTSLAERGDAVELETVSAYPAELFGRRSSSSMELPAVAPVPSSSFPPPLEGSRLSEESGAFRAAVGLSQAVTIVGPDTTLAQLQVAMHDLGIAAVEIELLGAGGGRARVLTPNYADHDPRELACAEAPRVWTAIDAALIAAACSGRDPELAAPVAPSSSKFPSAEELLWDLDGEAGKAWR